MTIVCLGCGHKPFILPGNAVEITYTQAPDEKQGDSVCAPLKCEKERTVKSWDVSCKKKHPALCTYLSWVYYTHDYSTSMEFHHQQTWGFRGGVWKFDSPRMSIASLPLKVFFFRTSQVITNIQNGIKGPIFKRWVCVLLPGCLPGLEKVAP